MEINELPFYDQSDNPTDCCPRFNAEGWDDRTLHFDNKLFVKAQTRSAFHIPVNMGPVFTRTFAAIEDQDAMDPEHFIVMSRDDSAWKGSHYFAVEKEVPGQEMVALSGTFRTKVFEGPFKDAAKWIETLDEEIGERKKDFFFYTTCPKCAKVYGKNYVVAISQID